MHLVNHQFGTQTYVVRQIELEILVLDKNPKTTPTRTPNFLSTKSMKKKANQDRTGEAIWLAKGTHAQKLGRLLFLTQKKMEFRPLQSSKKVVTMLI